MTIQIRDIVINTRRFIFADLGSSSLVRVWMEGMPAPANYVAIRVKDYEEGQKVLEEINAKCKKKN